MTVLSKGMFSTMLTFRSLSHLVPKCPLVCIVKSERAETLIAEDVLLLRIRIYHISELRHIVAGIPIVVNFFRLDVSAKFSASVDTRYRNISEILFITPS